jgi:hypothetical protein
MPVERNFMIVALKFLFISCVAFSLFPSLSFAALEWSEEPVIPLIDEALDSAVAPDGSHLFVLTTSGNILVLDPSGKLKTTIDGPFNANSLTVSNDGKRLFLTGKGEKKLQVVSLLDRFNIPTGNSPVKGDIAAAVTVAVFSDFQ